MSQEELIDFPAALHAVIDGERVTKREWQNANIYLDIKDGFLTLHKADGTEHQLLVSEGDLLGLDWYVLPSVN